MVRTCNRSHLGWIVVFLLAIAFGAGTLTYVSGTTQKIELVLVILVAAGTVHEAWMWRRCVKAHRAARLGGAS